MIRLYKKIFYRRSSLALSKLVTISFVSFITSFVILINFWWFFDCKVCFGHNCGQSVCKNYQNHICGNQCYEENKINDNNIEFKISGEDKNAFIRYDSDLIWQKIYGFGIYVYSAFKIQNNVLIIAQTTNEYNNDYGTQFQCVFTDENKSQILEISDAIFEKFEKSFDYVSTRITCRSHPNSQYVKLVHKNNLNVRTNYTYINYNSVKESLDTEIVVCVRPLFGPYDSIRAVLEFIAYYKINGINKFVFYNDFVSKQVLQLLKSITDFVEIRVMSFIRKLLFKNQLTI